MDFYKNKTPALTRGVSFFKLILNRCLTGVICSFDQIVDIPAGRAAIAAGFRVFRADQFLSVSFIPRTVIVESFAAVFNAVGFFAGLNGCLTGVICSLNQIIYIPAGCAAVTAGQRIFRTDQFFAAVFGARTVVRKAFAAVFNAICVIAGLNGRLSGVICSFDQIVDIPAGCAAITAGQRVFRADQFLPVVFGARAVVREPFAAVFNTVCVFVGSLNGCLAGVICSFDQIVDIPAGCAAIAAGQRVFRADQFFAAVFGARTVVIESFAAVSDAVGVFVRLCRNIFAFVVN